MDWHGQTLDHPELAPENTVTSSNPTATGEIRLGVSVWPPRMLLQVPAFSKLSAITFDSRMMLVSTWHSRTFSLSPQRLPVST